MCKHKLYAVLASTLSLSVLLSSCSYSQYGAVTSGASLGGILGSSIGGLMGGPRGSDKGTIAGLIIGGAVGAAATAQYNKTTKTPQPQTDDSTAPYADDTYNSGANNSDDVQYGSYNNAPYRQPQNSYADVQSLEISNLHFLDSNNNQRLDKDEKAYIVFDVHNRSNKTLYNITPNITCNSKRVVISAPATIANLLPNQGIRYKAAVVAIRNLKQQSLRFTISLGCGNKQVVVKTFEL